MSDVVGWYRKRQAEQRERSLSREPASKLRAATHIKCPRGSSLRRTTAGYVVTRVHPSVAHHIDAARDVHFSILRAEREGRP